MRVRFWQRSAILSRANSQLPDSIAMRADEAIPPATKANGRFYFRLGKPGIDY